MQGRKLLETLELPADPRPVLSDHEVGRIEEKMVVFVRGHVLPFHELIRVVCCHPVAGPFQLLKVKCLQHRAQKPVGKGRLVHVGLEFE